MATQTNFLRRLGRTAIAGGLAMILAGCSAREYTREELSDSKIHAQTSSVDQIFINSRREVWVTELDSNGRVTQNYLGYTDKLYGGPLVKIYKDLPKNSSPYKVQYLQEGTPLQYEVHLQAKQKLQPASETRSAGKTTYQVENWEVEQ